MKMCDIRMLRHMRGTICFLAALALVLGATRPAAAQWTVSNTSHAWSSYNGSYLYLEPDGYSKVFTTTEGGTTAEGFWTFAEEIEMAEDAYAWATVNDSSNLSTYETEVQALCDGFVYKHGDTWTSDDFNDDLDVAIIAFARAYEITGTTRWLTDAENNFNSVWSRAQAGDGGLCENTGASCYENSSVNWTFVIAGHLLTNYSGVSSYATHAASVYTWALSHLYKSSTGEIYDGGVPLEAVDYSYNYGYAIGAMSESGASATTVGSVATYLFNDMSNASYPYAGTYSGYNILPNYGQGNLNDSGFNGIAMRWIGIANGHGLIPSADIAAAKANITKAWSERNPTELIWNDWVATTPATGVYSWDASAAMTGLLVGQGW
jgi:hypothetical protein